MENKPNFRLVSGISPQPGNLYTLTLFKKPVKTICFSPISGHEAAALELAPFPYAFGLFKLTWSEVVTDKKTAEEATNKDGTKKYQTIREFVDAHTVIGYRTEYVPYLKEVEEHPFVVESTSSIDGVSTEIVIDIILKIDMPKDGKSLKILALQNPFNFVFSYVNEAILRWANAKSSKAIRNMNTDDCENPLDEITIGSEFYLDYLNRETFAKYEITVTNVNLRMVALAKRSAVVLDGEQKVAVAESATKEADETKKQRIALSQAKDAENKVALSFYKGKLEAKETFIKNSAAALKDINSGYATGTQLKVLSIGENKALTDFLIGSEAADEI